MNFTIKPLGGVGQIGSNSTLFSAGDTNIIVDCGILFPNDDHFDINYLIPDLSHVVEGIDALIITHGHEDHIGAIYHYIMRFPEAMIYAPPFARELILEKLSHKNISKEILNLDDLEIGDFKVTPIHVNHSIPDTFGLFIEYKDCSVLFISDFKIDRDNTYENFFDFEKLNQFSKNTFKIAMLDSTNIRSRNLETPSELSVADDLEKIILETSGTVFLTTFASNVHRVQTVFNICKKHNIAVIPYGPSMKKYIDIAEKLEILNTHGIMFDADNKAIKRKKVVLATGSQGEMRGATNRIATGNDKFFKLTENDAFIFSSKAIPGNEKTLSGVYNKISRLGAKVYASDQYHIHVSGHPGRDDLKNVYQTYKPDIAIPIHGESLFIKNHADFVKKEKLANEVYAIENFDQILIKDKEISIKKAEEVPPIIIHGKDLEIDRSKISERRKLASLGIVSTSISKKSIQFSTMGIPELSTTQNDQYIAEVRSILNKSKNAEEEIRVFTRRYFSNILGYRPLSVVHLH